MGFKEVIVGVILVSLFAFSLGTYAVGIASINNANTSLADDPRFSAFNTSVSSNLGDIQGTATEQQSNFESEDPQTGFGEITLTSIVGVSRTFTSSTFGFIGGLVDLVFSTLFGNNSSFSIIISALFAILIIYVIFYLWRVYRTGD